MNHHELILASAGTGKTFQLTGRFIALLARGVPPSSILATTFTRKAAHEILERVLRRLADAANGGKELETLRAHAAPDLTQARCLELLNAVLADVNRLSILTIDSFLVRLAGRFGGEIGLPPDWRIVEDDEDERIRSEAIGAAIGVTDRHDKDAVSILLDRLGRKTSSIRTSLTALVKDVYAVHRRIPGPVREWGTFAPMGTLLSADQLAAAINAAKSGPTFQTQAGKPDGRFTKARTKILEAAQNQKWSEALLSTLGTAVWQKGTYYGIQITDDISANLRPIIEHAVACEFNALQQRNDAARTMLDRFEKEYLAQQGTLGVRRFDDIPTLLADSGMSDRLEEIYFRLDASLHHVLLDEFQDTSAAQFASLSPILEETLAYGDESHSSFCVGDEKQSLYAWRDAEPDLLCRMEIRWPQYTRRMLDENQRSSPVVLDAVNTVFAEINKVHSLRDSRVAADFAKRFRPHDAAHPEYPGIVRILQSPHKSASNAASVDFTIERIKQITESFPWMTIGVLVRSNAPVAPIVTKLLRKGIEASAESGNPLMDSRACAAAISLLQLAAHPWDTAAAFDVATSPLGRLLGLRDQASSRECDDVVSRVRGIIASDGIGGLLARLRLDTADSMSPRDQMRFDQLVQLAMSPAATRLTIDEFVELVRSKRIDSPAGARVRVMTIHGAKGLEFDAVVLPQLEGPWGSKLPAGFYRRRQPATSEVLGPLDGLTVQFPAAMEPYLGEIGELRRATAERSRREEICNLYVAMTRAKFVLEAIVCPPTKSVSETPTATRVLRHAFNCDTTDNLRGILWQSEGADEHGLKLAAMKPVSVEVAPASVKLEIRTDSTRRRPRLSAPSSGSRVSAAGILDSDSRGRDFGSAVHAMFELIEWHDGALPSDELLSSLSLEHTGDPGLASRAKDMFIRSLAGKIGDALSRDRYGSQSELRVWREKEFVVRGESAGAFVRGRFDRVVIVEERGIPVRAEIIDFKTDSVEPGFERGHASIHASQMRAYRSAIAAMLRLDPATVAMTLAFVSTGAIVTLDE